MGLGHAGVWPFDFNTEQRTELSFFFISLLLFLLQYIWRFVRCNINVFVPAITIDWLKQSKRHSCQQSNNVSKTFKTNLTNHFHLISPSINTSYAYVRAKV